MHMKLSLYMYVLQAWVGWVSFATCAVHVHVAAQPMKRLRFGAAAHEQLRHGDV